MAEIHERRDIKIVEHNVSFLCPVCHSIIPGGKVTCEIHVDFDPFADPASFDFSRTALLTYPQDGISDFRSSQMIMVTCRNCDHKMIAVDSGIVEIVQALNQIGAYTVASCAGHRKRDILDKPYIGFYSQMSDELQKAIIDAVKAPALSSPWDEDLPEDYVPISFDNIGGRTFIYILNDFAHYKEIAYQSADVARLEPFMKICNFLDSDNHLARAYLKQNERFKNLFDVYREEERLLAMHDEEGE